MVGSRIGIALGSGGARGWAHIGVLRALAAIGIQPSIVCGCSAGAIVGAAYAAGNLDALERQVLALTKLEMMRFFEVNFSLNGFVKRERLQQFFQEAICPAEWEITQLPYRFASVATNLENGREVWFTQGKVLDAVWGSVAVPGLFPPVRHGKAWVVDGGLVNPVPVSLCRAMGAEWVIAVNLNGIVARRYARHAGKQGHDKGRPEGADKPEADSQAIGRPASGLVDTLTSSLLNYSAVLFPDLNRDKVSPPGITETLTASINIMQDKITRSRMAGDPPEVLLAPRLEHIGLLEFFRAEEAMREAA